ncbi:hypothetical protein [Polyangium spumosum]|uniref:Uncharacterized protein n=1 Tax=Polyangium spumosum TaxID=889282 RepID=A0A6N7PTQ1_9BACT|nr:hypothetical protein [Polyangium spumosum]MRG95363.1 hypothetical protein [Polyangium spumosum]
MAKLILGLGALFLYSSLGIASSTIDVQQASLTTTDAGTNEPGLCGSDTIQTNRISEEERERRVQECETLFEACRDWCTRGKLGARCYAECSRKLADCMKKIPYAE